MKAILLQTMPHTGTHTMHYLFNVLGGIQVVWHHWEAGLYEDIEIALNELNWDDYVFVRTYRDPPATLESYKSRAISDEAGLEYYDSCVDTYAKYAHRFPMPIGIHIDGPRDQKTGAALEVFRRCGVEPSEAALEYMKSWKRIGSQHDSEAPSRAIKESIHKGRVGIWHTN